MIKKKRGFTLIELLVVIAIIAILAAILFPVFMAARAKARASTCMSNMKQIAAAFTAYTADFEERLPCTYHPTGQNGQLGMPLANVPNNMIPRIWCSRIDPYLKQGNVVGDVLTGCFVCPEQEKVWIKAVQQGKPDAQSYGYNFLFLGLPYWFGYNAQPPNIYAGQGFAWGPAKVGRLARPAETILLVETWSLWAFPPFDNTTQWPAAGSNPMAGNQFIRPRHNGKTNVAWVDGHTSSRDTADLVTRNVYFGNGSSKEVGRALNNELWDRL